MGCKHESMIHSYPEIFFPLIIWNYMYFGKYKYNDVLIWIDKWFFYRLLCMRFQDEFMDRIMDCEYEVTWLGKSGFRESNVILQYFQSYSYWAVILLKVGLLESILSSHRWSADIFIPSPSKLSKVLCQLSGKVMTGDRFQVMAIDRP